MLYRHLCFRRRFLLYRTSFCLWKQSSPQVFLQGLLGNYLLYLRGQGMQHAQLSLVAILQDKLFPVIIMVLHVAVSAVLIVPANIRAELRLVRHRGFDRVHRPVHAMLTRGEAAAKIAKADFRSNVLCAKAEVRVLNKTAS